MGGECAGNRSGNAAKCKRSCPFTYFVEEWDIILPFEALTPLYAPAAIRQDVVQLEEHSLPMALVMPALGSKEEPAEFSGLGKGTNHVRECWRAHRMLSAGLVGWLQLQGFTLRRRQSSILNTFRWPGVRQ